MDALLSEDCTYTAVFWQMGLVLPAIYNRNYIRSVCTLSVNLYKQHQGYKVNAKEKKTRSTVVFQNMQTEKEPQDINQFTA